MGEGTEKDVLRKALAGDREAVREFYALYVDALYAYAFYRLGRNVALAEEAVSEIFHKAVLTLDAYDPARGEVYTWLVTIGRGVVTAILRREQRWRRHELSWEAADRTLLDICRALDQDSIPDMILEREETRHLVQAAMGQLPPKYRRLLELRYWKGKTTSELALVLSLTEKAVESLLARGREAFRKSLESLSRELGSFPSLEKP
jgi:RNA polymerase sigma-70 factor, ECF subfamily